MLDILYQQTCSKCGGLYHTLTEEKESRPCLVCCFPEKKNTNEVTIVPALLNVSQLGEVEYKHLWRPESFDDYVGQESLKDILKGYIKGCKELSRPFPHFLVDGKAGTGKTTIAYILAKQLGLTFVECVANTVKSQQQFVDLLVQTDGGILFLDEIQVINKSVASFILPILEDFQISGKAIKPFTLFGCTTEKGTLLKKWKPLVDRFRIQKTLDAYILQELAILIKQYKDKTFKNLNVEESVYTSIALNCRLTPRIAIRLLESYVYMAKPLNEVYNAYNIVKNGITQDDIKVLKLLSENEKGLGLNSICAYLQTSQENFMYSMESYLIEQGLLTIGNRRQITLKGKELLEGLKNVS
jgi:Holliday junction DNA helicase RuvB